MRHVDFDNLDHSRSLGPQVADALRRQDCGDVPLNSQSTVSAARIDSSPVQRAVVGEIYPIVPREMVAFSGSDDLGLVVATAANFERNGMPTVARWWRGVDGLIHGIAICAADEGER